jgi:hypothetical protein
MIYLLCFVAGLLAGEWLMLLWLRRVIGKYL